MDNRYKIAVERVRDLLDNGDKDGLTISTYRKYFEDIFPELKETENEKMVRCLINVLENDKKHYLNEIEWLNKQKSTLQAILWDGTNLKEVIEFTGKYKKFDEWFNSWDEYEEYVHNHDNIFKIFNPDESFVEVPVNTWIIKLPEGYVVPILINYIPVRPSSKVIKKGKPIPVEQPSTVEESQPNFKVGDTVVIKCKSDRPTGILRIYDGKVGKITDIWDLQMNPWGNIGVELDNGCNSGFLLEELEHV